MRDLRPRLSGLPLRSVATATVAISMISMALPAQAQHARWTWTLYADSSPVVLAHEIPDTPRLRTTLECEPGSAMVHVSLYDEEALIEGPGTLSAGDHESAAQIEARDTRRSTSIRIDHPVFIAFQASGTLDITAGDHTGTVRVSASNLPKLIRFSQICAS